MLGLFGYGKQADPTADARAAGEKTGELEIENASLTQYTAAEQGASMARDAVVDDPVSVYNDPANRRQAGSAGDDK